MRWSRVSWQELVIVAAITILGSVVHGTTGIGLGLVAGPALLAIDPRFVPGPLLLSTLIVGSRHLVVERRNIDRAILARLIIGLPFGTVAALLLMTNVDQRMMALGIGGLVMMASTALLLGLELPRTPPYEVVGGAAAAFGSMTAAIPGPALVLSLHDMPGPSMRPTLAAIGNILGLVAAVGLAAVGRFGPEELKLLGLLVPFVLGGLYLARFVRPWLDHRFFRSSVLCLALAGGAGLAVANI